MGHRIPLTTSSGDGDEVYDPYDSSEARGSSSRISSGSSSSSSSSSKGVGDDRKAGAGASLAKGTEDDRKTGAGANLAKAGRAAVPESASGLDPGPKERPVKKQQQQQQQQQQQEAGSQEDGLGSSGGSSSKQLVEKIAFAPDFLFGSWWGGVGGVGGE